MAESLRRVGRYELIEVVGRGGTAVVYLATQSDLERQVALKELSPHHAGDPRFAARFVEESRLVAALNHPNIVTVHEYFEEDGLPYIAMEYLPRGSLRPYLSTLSLPQIFGVAENVLAALEHGETHHIIHRDLKPENLLVSGDGQVKISDYGVARALDSIGQRSFATMTGTTIGTPAYMAPEQALGEGLGPEADIYALGVIVWEALAGRPPFGSADTPMAVLYQKIHEPVPRIQELEPDVDPGLAQWLDVALAKSAGARFSSAAQAWEDLEDVAIKLLGPRWRRDARINLEIVGVADADGHDPRLADTETGEEDRLTPASTARTPSPEAGQTPEANQATDAAPASDGEGAQADAADPLPPAQSAPPRPGPGTSPAAGPAANETMMRLSRRHLGADDELEEDEEPASSRRWIAWAGLAAVIVVAAVIGVVVALATNPKAPKAGTRTQTTPTVALAAGVRPILTTLSAAQAAGLKKLAAQRNSAGQESAARALQKDYLTAATSLSGLPASQRKLASFSTLDAAVRTLALDWEKAAYAAKTKNSAGYTAARSAVEAAAPKLAAAATVAAAGAADGTTPTRAGATATGTTTAAGTGTDRAGTVSTRAGTGTKTS